LGGKKKKKKKKGHGTVLVFPLKQILVILAIVIYKILKTSPYNLDTFILFRPLISTLCQKALKVYIGLIINWY
jgi:hypothetical protein